MNKNISSNRIIIYSKEKNHFISDLKKARVKESSFLKHFKSIFPYTKNACQNILPSFLYPTKDIAF